MNKKKQGYKDPVTSLVFVGYQKDCKNGEYWLSPEKYAQYLERKRKAAKKFRQLNQEKCRELSRKSYRKHKKERNKKNKEYRIKNKEYVYSKNKEWVLKNKDYIRQYMREYTKKRREEDPLFAIKERYRSRITDIFRSKKYTKNLKTIKMLGCSWEELRLHIENQFLENMNWDNRDKWHIDHIIPLASAKSPEEVEKLCHYTNLQPLWASDNMSKGAKLVLDNTGGK
jgi:hypothetical protein